MCLKLDHKLVVDTALLYQRESEPNHNPSLKDLASAVLGTALVNSHDSVVDARAALMIAHHFRDNGSAGPVPRLAGKKPKREGHMNNSLLLHRYVAL